MPTAAKVYIDVIITAGLAIAVYGVFHWNSLGAATFALFLALFAGAALLKGRIPGITGTYSPVFFFVLVGSTVLSFSEIVFAAGLAGLVQCTCFVQRRPSAVQIAFNAANMMISTAAAFAFISGGLPALSDQPLLIRLILGAAVYYVVNTGLVSLVLTLVDSKPIQHVWSNWCLGSLPYYLFGALIAGATLSAQNHPSLYAVGMVCPSVLLATVYYRYWLSSSTQFNPLVS